MSSTATPKFGRHMRQHFLFDDKWVNLNHGAFGTYPKPVANVRSNLLKTVEKTPDQFLRYDHLSLLNESRTQLAKYLHVPTDEVVMVANATLALTIVLRNLTFEEKDVILCFESIYSAIDMTIRSMQETSPQIHIHRLDYETDTTKPEYPKTHDGICESFTQTVHALHQSGLRVKVAIFETISSIPAVRLPFERLTHLCRSQNILSVIDGAHGVGQIPLHLGELDADFFITNCHKWLYVPRGCAVMHIPRRNQHLIRTAIPTSWSFELLSKGEDSPARFLNQFDANATADNTPFYTIPAALEFRRDVCGGESDILAYSKDIAQRGSDLVAAKLGTVVLQEPGTAGNAAPTSGSSAYQGLRDSAMANILLPFTVDDPEKLRPTARWLQRIVPAEYDTSVSFFPYHGRVWVRLSGQIYLELADFEWFADILIDLCRRVEAGEPFGASATKSKET